MYVYLNVPRFIFENLPQFFHGLTKMLYLTMSLLFKNQTPLLALFAGICTADSLPTRSQAHLFTVPKCTIMKAAQALQDKIT